MASTAGPRVVGREFESDVHHENVFVKKSEFPQVPRIYGVGADTLTRTFSGQLKGGSRGVSVLPYTA